LRPPAIVFSYNGFQSPVNLAGEGARSGAQRSVRHFRLDRAWPPWFYLLLQTAYLGAVAAGSCWPRPAGTAIDFLLAVRRSGQGCSALHGWRTCCSSTRSSARAAPASPTPRPPRACCSACSATAPCRRMFGTVHNVWGIPRAAMWFNLAVSYVFLLFFRGLGHASPPVISVAHDHLLPELARSVRWTLRRTAPELRRPLHMRGLADPRLPGVRVRDRAACTGAKWPLTGGDHPAGRGGLADLFLLPGKPTAGTISAASSDGAWWLIAYLPTIAFVSYIGSNQVLAARTT